ncbi:MAG: hypothetical protein KF857_08060 [Fimbriimonadaceae bacterium]|nr:hypothetical protein [Fimbriimonadaceae bacterium]
MPSPVNIEAYELAQEAVSLMKSAIIRVLADHPEGLKNSEIGRRLGVNADFLDDQQGWFQYTVLKIMELERTVEQPKSRGPWRLVQPRKVKSEGQEATVDR